MARSLTSIGLVGHTAVFNITASVVSAVTGILLARWLGASGRGTYAAVTAYLGILLVFADMGIASAIVYFVSRYREAADTYVRTAIALFVPLCVAAISLTVAVAVWGLGAEDPRRVPLLVMTACIAATMLAAPPSFALQSVSILRWNIMRLLQPLLMFLLLLIWMLWNDLSVTTVVALMAVSFALQAAYGWVAYLRQKLQRGRVDVSKVRPMVRFGLANVASTGPNAINARFDQLVLAALVAPAVLGQYAVAVSLSLLAGPLALAFGNVAFPKLAGGDGDIAETIRTSVRGAAKVAFVGAAVVVLAAPFVVGPVFGDGYETVPKLLCILAPGAVLFVVNQVMGDLLRGLRRPGIVARCEWIGLFVTFAGLGALVPPLGAYGAALASTTAYVVVYIMLRFALRQAAVARIVGTHA